VHEYAQADTLIRQELLTTFGNTGRLRGLGRGIQVPGQVVEAM
jgi:hypothetical protein